MSCLDMMAYFVTADVETFDEGPNTFQMLEEFSVLQVLTVLRMGRNKHLQR